MAGSKAWEGRVWAADHGESPRLGMNLCYLSRIEPAATKEYSRCRVALQALLRAAEAHPAAERAKYSPPTLPIW